MKCNKFLALLCAVVLATTALSFSQSKQAPAMQDQTMNLHTGKTGYLNVIESTLIGNVTLVPGEYAVKHRSDGAGDYVEFIRMVPREARSDRGAQAFAQVITAEKRARG